MEEKNNVISTFQFAVIVALIADSFFVGIGISNIFNSAMQDAWIVSLVSLVIGFIPILILIYIINYKPEMNIFEKNKSLFGNVIGNIANLILCIFVLFSMVIVLTSTTAFSNTMYLTKTPSIIISLVFILPAVYAVIKGIETIGRTSEFLFFLAVIIVSFIVFGLYPHFKFDLLKPILADGIKPIVKSSIMFMSYNLSPLILLTIIPKNNIKDNKNLWKYFIFGYIISVTLMFLVYFIIPGVITPKLASIYRFPAYYVQRKISIGAAINNVENITSIHWFFNTFVHITMSIYFLTIYFKDLFKIKKEKILNCVSFAIVILTLWITSKVFKNPNELLHLMKNLFPNFISSILLFILLITSLLIFTKKRRAKKV